MNLNQKQNWLIFILVMLMGVVLIISGCNGKPTQTETAVSPPPTAHTETNTLRLPELQASALNGKPLKVVATTSIIGDVVAQIGGDAIDLTTLMSAVQDPHSYEPGARELTAVADANIIFVNGWDLEESLVHNLAEIGGGVPLIPISANIEPLTFGENKHVHEEDSAEHEETADNHEHSGADPHVWFSIANVAQWAENVAQILSALDPANAGIYAENAAAYRDELKELEAYATIQLGQIPEENRFLVTNHDSLNYFAHDYGLELVGTVIPGASTLAEPSASDLAFLIEEMGEHNLCTLFTETTVSDTLAQTVAGELNNCDEVKVVTLYTGSVGPMGSGADSYIGLFRANVDAIVAGLR